MSARPFTQPFHTSKGTTNLSTSSPSKHSLLSPDSKKHSSPSPSTRQPHTSANASTHLSSPPRRVTTPVLHPKCLCRTALTLPKDLLATTSKRGQPCSSSSGGNGAPPPSDGNEPFNAEIKDMLQEHPYPEGRDGYLNILRCMVMNFAAMSYNPKTEVISGRSDVYIKQLVRVLDELKTTGECRVGGETIRPG